MSLCSPGLIWPTRAMLCSRLEQCWLGKRCYMAYTEVMKQAGVQVAAIACGGLPPRRTMLRAPGGKQSVVKISTRH